jgi:hypothetical protein
MAPWPLACSVAAVASLVSPLLVTAHEGPRAPSIEASIDAPTTATVGARASVVCVAADPDGISRVSLKVTSPDGRTTTLGATFGAAELRVEWIPVLPGTHALRCDAKGMSAEDARRTVARAVEVVGAPAVETPAAAPPPVVAPEPAAGPTFPQAAPPLGSVDSEGTLPVKMVGPRRVAATPAGDLYVVDRAGVLLRLTRRGEVVGALLGGAVSVAAGADLVFAALKTGEVVGLRPATGRVVTRMDLGAGEPAVGLAYDGARGRLWLAFASGVVQVRALDGTVELQLTATPSGPLVRLVDVALSPSGVAWVTQDRAEADGYLHAFDAETGAFVRSVASGAGGQARVIGALAAAWGRLYVADLFSGNVRVMNENGETLELLGKPGFGPGELALPSGVTFMVNGDVVVASQDANRLERFGAGAALPACPGDADCDGLPDAWELANGLDPNDPRDLLADADHDGLNAAEEYARGTSPRKADTDGDGFSDGAEVAAGFDPLDPRDHDPVMVVEVPSVVDPGVVRLAARIDDRGRLGGCVATWRQLAGPVIALDRHAVAPSFIARRGLYRFAAAATCGGRASAPAEVTVAVRNLPARVELPRVVTAGPRGEVDVSARFSSDVNGDELRFEWDQVLGRPVSEARGGATLRAELAGAGLYAFQVTADDRWGHPATGEVAVVAVGAGGAPTAVAAPQVTGRAGEEVVLDASASFRGAGALFAWEQVDGEPVTLAGDGSVVRFVPGSAGRYRFKVQVVDGALRSPHAEVTVYVAPAGGALPIAAAYAPAVVPVNAAVRLSGAGSTGAGALRYAWRQVRGPAAGLTGADEEAATVVAFAPGAYAFELTVDDGAAASVPVQVAFEARAGGHPIPVAVASGPSAAHVGQRVALSGAASVRAVEWEWTQVEGPWVELSQRGPHATFRPHAPGVYGFELVVNDGKVRSAPARVNVVVGK